MRRLSREHLVPRNNRYGVYTPAIEIDDGETIVVETVNSWRAIIRSREDLSEGGYRREQTGPIYVRGIEPGDTIAIEIHEVRPEGHARSRVIVPANGAYDTVRQSFIEVRGDECHFPGVGWIPLRPMIGEIHVTPVDPDAPNPGDHGGNLDITLIRAGNVLYLTAQRQGGLVVLGDLHARMGEGEIFGIAGEMAGEVTVTFRKDNRLGLTRPAIYTGDALAVVASRVDRREAIRTALEDGTKVVQRVSGAAEEDARLYVVDCADLRNGGVFLEELPEHIPEQIRTVWMEIALDPLKDFPAPARTDVSA